MHYRFFPLVLAGITAPALAADAPGAASTGGLFQVLLILILVLGLMLGAAWLLKRFNVAGANSGDAIKIIGGVAVGSRERIIVVEVGEQWIVVGIAPGSINALSTMPKQEVSVQGADPALPDNFASRLKQFIERRNGQ